jgi:hypothetical protein
LSYTETSSFLEFERMAPIFRPEVINKIQNRVMGSAQTRRNPTSLLNRGRPTTGANATATTNPTGSQTMGAKNAKNYYPDALYDQNTPMFVQGTDQKTGQITRSPISTSQAAAFNNPFMENYPEPKLGPDGSIGPVANRNSMQQGSRPLDWIGDGVAKKRQLSGMEQWAEDERQATRGWGELPNEFPDPRFPSDPRAQPIGGGEFQKRIWDEEFNRQREYAASPMTNAMQSPVSRSQDDILRGAASALNGLQQDRESQGATGDFGGSPAFPPANSYQPPMGMISRGQLFNPDSYTTPGNIGTDTQVSAGIRGGGANRLMGSPPVPVEDGMGASGEWDSVARGGASGNSGAPKVDYFGNRDRRPRQIDRPLTPREAQDVNTEMAGTRELTGQMGDFVDQGRSRVPLVPNSPLQSNGQDPRIAAMEAESRRISRQGSILENSDIATSSGQARRNFQNLPSDMQQDAVATIPSQGYNGNIGYANDPDRYDPTDPGAQRQQEANAKATTQGRVREGNDAFGDRFRNAPQDDGFMTEAEKRADFERRAPAARAVADQMKADLAAQRAADPEAEYMRKRKIAEASADREAKHNAFKEKTGGLNYKQFDRLTRKTDLIEKKVGQGRITKEEAKRQVENETMKQGRRAEGPSSVASKRLDKMLGRGPSEGPNRPRLPNGELYQGDRDRANITKQQLFDDKETRGTPEFKQSKEIIKSLDIVPGTTAGDAAEKFAKTPFPINDPEAARRQALAYKTYWKSNSDADSKWTENMDPQRKALMKELAETPDANLDEWINKNRGQLAQFGPPLDSGGFLGGFGGGVMSNIRKGLGF